ncbi:MAG: ASKHA domain-containing protein, partial [Spirochaetota bacterium]
LVVVDMGTTTIVAHLLHPGTLRTVNAKACFNSQGIYGREVTRRMISAEKKGPAELQKMLVADINGLVESMADENGIHLKDITAVVCAGNTAMGHFLLGLPTDNIRRSPYVAASVEPPPVRAAEVGIEISPRGLLYLLPGISAWVGSDITAGILATGMHRSDAVSLLMDVGTNGEIVVGNRDWLVAASASAGPALEGASVSCGMRAEPGAIEKVYTDNGDLGFVTIDGTPPVGICGSGIIDAVSALLSLNIINRSGKIVGQGERITEVEGVPRYLFTEGDKPVYLTESDIENVITAKAAIFAAMNILLKRLDLDFEDIERYYIAGAFGNYIDVDNARAIGLLPSVERERIEFVGNTSMLGAKICALYREAFMEVTDIRRRTTYYDLMGAHDYVEEFQKALFLPHTDIEMFAVKARR